MANFFAFLGMSSDFDPSYTFVSSWLLPPAGLACLRMLLSIYCFTTLFFSFSWFATHIVTFHLQDVSEPSYSFSLGSEAIGQSFSYFTYLSYWGLAFYFFVSGVHTFVYAFKHDTWLHRGPRLLQALHSFFYTTAVCIPFLVTSVFWLTMWIGPWYLHDFDAWSNISIHAVNSAFALLEITLPTTKSPPWLHLGGLLIILALYLGLAYLTHLTQHIYVYEWLDPRFGIFKILAHILGITVGMVVIFTCVKGLIILRNHLLILRNKNTKQESETSSIHFISSPLIQHNDIEKSHFVSNQPQIWTDVLTSPQYAKPYIRPSNSSPYSSVRNFSRVHSFTFEPLRPHGPF